MDFRRWGRGAPLAARVWTPNTRGIGKMSRLMTHTLAVFAGAAVATGLVALISHARASNARRTPHLAHKLDPKLAERGIAPVPRRHTKLFDVNSLYIYRLCLTGGPCAGKTSSLDHLTKALTARGFDVYCCPEIPTILLNGGCRYPGIDGGDKLIQFEVNLLKLQLQAERSFLRIAMSTGRPSVIVMDRGLLDPSAYLPAEAWEEIMATNDWTEDYFLGRYDAVLHLVTAADGAEPFYSNDNNAARYETVDEARALDKRILKAWENHKNLKVIDNSTNFEQKLKRATNFVLHLVEDRETGAPKKKA